VVGFIECSCGSPDDIEAFADYPIHDFERSMCGGIEVRPEWGLVAIVIGAPAFWPFLVSGFMLRPVARAGDGYNDQHWTFQPMSKSENEVHEALKLMNGYYNTLTGRMAEEIMENREDFESPGFGSRADDVVEKYARHIDQLGTVYRLLRWKAYRKKPEGREPLGKYDFRCFGCGGVIRSTDEACTVCGCRW
jgi:hypothetical protein